MQKRVIWITGASSGIGEELAIQYAQRGDYLILSARRVKELERVKSLCTDPERVVILPLDLTAFESHEKKAEVAWACFGQVDVLINNGGVSQRSLIEETNFSVYKQLIEINYLGTVSITKAILPYFLKRKKGHYAVVTSVMGKYGSPFRSGYSAAKHALHGFFDVLRMEHHKDNIAVSLICPGFVQTQVTVNALTSNGQKLGHDDPATKKGLAVRYFCKKMIRAIDHKAWETYYGRKEKLGVYLKRLSQKLLHSIVIRSKVR
ncbi:MAG: SDR family oxidoreductase, partial [Flavobacteriaceae bacterium]